MISYELYCQIQLFYKERGLSFAQIGRELNLDEETVAKWARQKTYSQRLKARRKSKLDPYKPIIQRWLEQHPYSATQVFQRLRAEEAYTGGISILTDYVRRVRPVRAPAFLTLAASKLWRRDHLSSSARASPPQPEYWYAEPRDILESKSGIQNDSL